MKLYGEFLWAKSYTMGLGRAWGCPEGGGTTHQGVPGGPGAPMWIMPTSVASCTASSPYKLPNIPKTLGESTKYSSSRH